jgi:hypothetical protein
MNDSTVPVFEGTGAQRGGDAERVSAWFVANIPGVAGGRSNLMSRP